MSTRAFRISLDKWAAMSSEQLDALARQVCFEAASRVVNNTPVDTGFLRGSWQPSLSGPKVKTAAANDPGGANALSEIGLTIMGMKAGDRFWMLNGCAYAKHVEFGTATMEGRHYVQRVVKSWRAIVSSVLTDLGVAA